MEADDTVDDGVLANAEGAVHVVRSTSASVDDRLEAIDALASEQSGDMAEVRDDVAELSASIEEVAASTTEVSELTGRATDAATEGKAAAGEAATAMATVEEAMASVTTQVEAFLERADRIDELLEVIDGLADETDLLALNASIQAARRRSDGFAVVAEEIKDLANESQERTGEIEAVVEELHEATARLETTVEDALEATERGTDRLDKAETTLEVVTDATAEAAEGIEEVSRATADQARASERVAERCEDTAESTTDIERAVAAISEERSHQTAMLGEVESALEVATRPRKRRLAEGKRIPTGLEAIDDLCDGGLIEGSRAVFQATESADEEVADIVATVTASALEAGYAVSLSPPAGLDRRTLSRALGRTETTIRTAFAEDRLFVLDLYGTWERGENVFDFDGRSLGAVNERVDARRDRPLVVIGNIAGEIHAFGEEAAREATYDNDGGVLADEDTVLNVLEGSVPTRIASFYLGAADQALTVDGDDGETSVELVSAPRGRTGRRRRLEGDPARLPAVGNRESAGTTGQDSSVPWSSS